MLRDGELFIVAEAEIQDDSTAKTKQEGESGDTAETKKATEEDSYNFSFCHDEMTGKRLTTLVIKRKEIT